MENENVDVIKRKPGRPKKYLDIPDDCVNRRYKVNVKYLNERYKNSEEFKRYRKIKNALYRKKRIEKLNIEKLNIEKINNEKINETT